MQNERELLIRDKYNGDASADLSEDLARLSKGEPLAYVIGWIPFLGLRIQLDSHPLIPRPETEWWTEKLIAHLKERFGDTPFTFLDLCAGSGAIGLSVLASFPNAHVAFGELAFAHTEQIKKNISVNGLDASRAEVASSDLFASFKDTRFDVIATNPPYIPEGRVLDASVTEFEPPLALFSGEDGLTLIRRIAKEVPGHMNPEGELWMECDIENVNEAGALLKDKATATEIHTDLYGRPRVVVGYYS